MKSLLALVATTMLACSAAPVSSDAGAIDAGSPIDAGSAIDATHAIDASEPIEAGPPPVNVSGNVVDPDDAPWAAANVQVCSGALCTLGKANASGAFDVAVPEGNLYHVIARPPSTDAREGSAGLAVLANVLTTDTTLAAPIAIPITGAHQTLGAPALVASDLTLTANAADLAFDDDAYLAGTSVAESEWPAFVVAGRTILAMWALDPWGTRANTGKTIGVSIANHFGLAAGASASVYAVNELTAELGAESDATVSADGATIDGATIDRVTWIVLAH
jgi:hypothetical protein